MRKAAVAAVTVTTLLLLTSVASARTYNTRAGDPAPPSVPASAPAGTTLNAFFPKSLKVRRNDRVRYTNFGFHTVSVLGRGIAPPPLALPDPAGGTYSGINKADGTPFFFNGQPKLIFNPDVFLPVGNLNVSDRKTHSTGAFTPQGPNQPGVKTLRFSRVGSYKVLCLIHPGMEQSVRVVRKRKQADKTSAVRARTIRQTAAGYRAAAAAADDLPGANEVFAGQESRQASLLAFAPKDISVAAGTTVTFTNNAPSEVHDMVFTGAADATGKGAAQDFATTFIQTTDLPPFIPPGTSNQLSPGHAYGSEPPVGGPYTYTGTNAGNGFLFTPLMDTQPGDPPTGLPGATQVRFTVPGKYAYFCGIHGVPMSGTVTVT